MSAGICAGASSAAGRRCWSVPPRAGHLIACGSDSLDAAVNLAVPANAPPQTPIANVTKKMVTTTEPLNKFEEITGYNNYYEFGTGKSDPAKYAGQLKTSPWTVKIDGLCNKPGDYTSTI